MPPPFSPSFGFSAVWLESSPGTYLLGRVFRVGGAGVRWGMVMGDVWEVVARPPSRGALSWFSRRSDLARPSFSTPSPCRGFSPPVRTASLSRPCPGRSSLPNLSGATTANSELEGLRSGDHSRSAGFGRLGKGRGRIELGRQ